MEEVDGNQVLAEALQRQVSFKFSIYTKLSDIL